MLVSINATLSDFNVFGFFFCAKNQPKIRHFCMDFRVRRFSRYHLTSWHLSGLSLKPPKSFKLGNTRKTVFFLFPFEFDLHSVDSPKKTSRKRLGKMYASFRSVTAKKTKY